MVPITSAALARRNLIVALLLGAVIGLGQMFSPSPRPPVSPMPSDANLPAHWSGRLYTTAENQRFGKCAWSDWFLHKSKKVWFRIPEPWNQGERSRLYFYGGRPILHRSTWKSLSSSDRALIGPVILWGDQVASGWGAGPEGTNHFLYIWTRWSLLQPGACGHPERFEVEMGSPRAASVQQAGVPQEGS